MSPAPFISLKRIHKSFGNVDALIDVDLHLAAGEVHVVLGENGAGKSTLASILSGIHQPDTGEVYLHGQVQRLTCPQDALKHGISTVFQHARLVPTLSLIENVALGGPWWRTPSRRYLAEEMHRISRRLAPQSSIDPDARTDTLSLGEKQHAEIVRALMRGSRALILDEATAALTPQGANDLGRLMRRLAKGDVDGRDGTDAAMAVMFITHKLDEALDFGDRITIMRRGRKVAEIVPGQMDWDRKTARHELVKLMFGSAVTEDHSFTTRRPSIVRKPTPVLEANRLFVADPRMPLTDINLTINAGEILGIAGIDGNGQQQLAEALAGQRHIQHGTIMLGDKPVTHLSVGERTRLGLRYATDDRLHEGTVGTLSIAVNLLLKRIGAPPFWRRGIVRDSLINEHARVAIAAFDVRATDETTPIGHLSGGNIQKVLLARELSEGARAIIFAKPTHGLDIQSTSACRQRIRQAADEGVAVLLISSDLDEILALSDRIMVMSGGSLSAAMDNNHKTREQVGNIISQAKCEAA